MSSSPTFDTEKKIATPSVHVGSRKKISEVISGFVMPHLLHYSVPLYLLHLQICLLGNTLSPISSPPPQQGCKMVCRSMINSNQDYDHGLAQVNFVRTHECKLISDIFKFSLQTHKTHSWESCTNLNNGII